MRPPARLVAAVAGLALLSPTIPAVPAAAAAVGPLEDAAAAAARVPFSARVEVSWVAADGLHTAELTVRSVGGSVSVQGPLELPGQDGATLVRQNVASGDLLAPSIEDKYVVERAGGPVVAGRETDLLTVRTAGRVSERLAIDKATGLVLHREVLGPEGRPIRQVTVLQLDTAPVPAPAGGAGEPGDRPRSLQVSSLPQPYRAPAVLPGGYQRVGAYRHDRVVQLLYTDGLHGLSLFSQRGELASSRLPRGGRRVAVGASAGVRYTWAGGEVITWQSGPMVHTLVGDATVADLLSAARSLPRPARPALFSRLRSTAREVVELVSGGR